MQIDVVFLSNAKNEELRLLTQQAIDICIASDKNVQFNIIVIEQNENVAYENCRVHYDSSEFNYNRFANKGISLGASKYVAICNNDLLFKDNWASILIDAMQKRNVLSACPVCPHVQPRRMDLSEEVYYGYRNSHEVSGWCIMMDRDIFNIIGKLDEDFPFWFSDNVYSEQLKRHNIQHILVSRSIVEHLGSKTLNTLPVEKLDEYTYGGMDKFIEKHPNNETAVFFSRNRAR